MADRSFSGLEEVVKVTKRSKKTSEEWGYVRFKDLAYTSQQKEQLVALRRSQNPHYVKFDPDFPADLSMMWVWDRTQLLRQRSS
eukprot:CAMPEP_0178451354 /NCGR_PEP_ID=MMETSP0689_2-20121128/43634_1 /TAXON_ID=160604 /ORGANISM="Amphidinium massartii, Strain CS-259" /LENGTH=83 /DNA_ID=CAMNT_0020076923 /DNA_START=1 /DNA_END=248 /DNA_ORIENTATION=-